MGLTVLCNFNIGCVISCAPNWKLPVLKRTYCLIFSILWLMSFITVINFSMNFMILMVTHVANGLTVSVDPFAAVDLDENFVCLGPSWMVPWKKCFGTEKELDTGRALDEDLVLSCLPFYRDIHYPTLVDYPR